MNKPLVTVIIATYKREQKLLRAIKSILNQTYENIELIIINDDSENDISNLLKFDENSQPPENAICSVIFKRIDNGKAVEVTYSKYMLPNNPKISDLMPLAISGKGTNEQINEFGNLWHERVKMVLMDDLEGMFVVNEVK